jgi:hypothetical protein
MLDGNETQARTVAKQLFSVWAKEQEGRTIRKYGSLPAWVACALSLSAVIWNAAVISGDVAENARRIDRLEVDQRQQARDNSQVIERMARIEAKLDLILEERK